MMMYNTYTVLAIFLAVVGIFVSILAFYFIYFANVATAATADATGATTATVATVVEKYEDADAVEAAEAAHIYFMTYKETANFFAKDRDRYVRNLSDLDLHARGVKTHVEYMNNIEDTAISFTDDEKELLERCAKDADKYLRNERFKDVDYGKHLDGNDIADIKWIFANTYTNYHLDTIKEYEQGLPHTRENVILLSKNVLKNDALNLTNTLLHEKIHIYQRYNPKIFDTIIKEMGLKELDRKHFKQAKYIRSNPDTNNKLYYYPTVKNGSSGSGSSILDIITGSDNSDDAIADDATGVAIPKYDIDKVMVCLYRNDKPNSINDVIQKNYTAEHPYEKIAYEIAENFYKNNKNKYINI
jgi:hypothetical protein